MANYRPLYHSYWSDPKVRELPVGARLLFIYLFSNKDCGQSGIYQISRGAMAESMNMINNVGVNEDGTLVTDTEETISHYLVVLEKAGFLKYDIPEHYLFIKNYFKYSLMNTGNPELLIKSVINNFVLKKKHSFWRDFVELYKIELQNFFYRIDHKKKTKDEKLLETLKEMLTLDQNFKTSLFD